MCTVQLPLGGNTTAVKNISYHIISYHTTDSGKIRKEIIQIVPKDIKTRGNNRQ
jgi:translation initiation factor IF-1